MPRDRSGAARVETDHAGATLLGHEQAPVKTERQPDRTLEAAGDPAAPLDVQAGYRAGLAISDILAIVIVDGDPAEGAESVGQQFEGGQRGDRLGRRHRGAGDGQQEQRECESAKHALRWGKAHATRKPTLRGRLESRAAQRARHAAPRGRRCLYCLSCLSSLSSVRGRRRTTPSPCTRATISPLRSITTV
jgi:hypothetical protein